MFQRIPIESLGTLASLSSEPLWDHTVKKYIKTKPCWCDRRLLWYPVPVKMWGIDLHQDISEEQSEDTDDKEFVRDPQKVPHSKQTIIGSNLPSEMGLGPDDLATSIPEALEHLTDHQATDAPEIETQEVDTLGSSESSPAPKTAKTVKTKVVKPTPKSEVEIEDVTSEEEQPEPMRTTRSG